MSKVSYALVPWPWNQSYMDRPWYYEESLSVNEEDETDTYIREELLSGSFIPSSRIKDVTPGMDSRIECEVRIDPKDISIENYGAIVARTAPPSSKWEYVMPQTSS